MENLLSALEKKIQTKSDLTLYLKEISSLKESVHVDDGRPLLEKVGDDLQGDFEHLLSFLKNKKETLTNQKEQLIAKKEEVSGRENELSNRKKEIEERLNHELSPKERKELQNKRRNLEKERRAAEEEIWNLEEKINGLEKEIYELDQDLGENLDNTDRQLEVLNAMEERLHHLPEIRIKLAYEPDADVLSDIRNRLEAEIGKPPVLDLEVDSGLVGGAIIEYQGRWGDFSLAKKMEKLNYRDLDNYA